MHRYLHAKGEGNSNLQLPAYGLIALGFGFFSIGTMTYLLRTMRLRAAMKLGTLDVLAMWGHSLLGLTAWLASASFLITDGFSTRKLQWMQHVIQVRDTPHQRRVLFRNMWDRCGVSDVLRHIVLVLVCLFAVEGRRLCAWARVVADVVARSVFFSFFFFSAFVQNLMSLTWHIHMMTVVAAGHVGLDSSLHLKLKTLKLQNKATDVISTKRQIEDVESAIDQLEREHPRYDSLDVAQLLEMKRQELEQELAVLREVDAAEQDPLQKADNLRCIQIVQRELDLLAIYFAKYLPKDA